MSTVLDGVFPCRYRSGIIFHEEVFTGLRGSRFHGTAFLGTVHEGSSLRNRESICSTEPWLADFLSMDVSHWKYVPFFTTVTAAFSPLPGLTTR
jgi:hypothetical protein